MSSLWCRANFRFAANRLRRKWQSDQSVAADMGYRSEDRGWVPGASVVRCEADRIERVGRGDDHQFVERVARRRGIQLCGDDLGEFLFLQPVQVMPWCQRMMR